MNSKGVPTADYQEVKNIRVDPAIMELAAEIASGSDCFGLERWRLEYLVRSVLAVDRKMRGLRE